MARSSSPEAERLAAANRSVAAQPRRIFITGCVLISLLSVTMFGLLGRVVQLQTQPDDRLAQSMKGRGGESRLLARRGTLTDTRGRVIASTRLGYRLFADPVDIDDISEFAVRVAHAIGDDPVRIDQLINEKAGSRYIVINDLLNDEQYKAVKELKLRGLATEPHPVREYQAETLASQLVGFVGDEHKGLDGVEFALDEVLRGEPGRVRTLRDVRRRPLWIENADYDPPSDGEQVRLSVDLMIQSIAERELAAACEKHKADRAEAVVMDSRTGQVLAMANWPPFDPGGSLKVDPKIRRNRCVTDAYEPGSIFKPFIHAACTDVGVARPNELIDCTTSGVWVTSYRRRLRDAHAHGLISWDFVLIYSSNIGMGKVGERLGDRRMYDALQAFGFGQRTGAALPGESPGIVNPLGKWTKYSLTSIPMGQEIAVTPIQMVKAFSAFANGGMIVTPSVLAGETDTPVFQRALDPKTADHTRAVLRRVVTEGTGRRANSKLYRLWGKTGTAQIPDKVNGGYIDRAYTASFICGAPLDDPRLITLVTVHQPDPSTGYYGGTVSAPPAMNIVEQTLTYLGVPADGEDAQRPSEVASLTD
ncbi:penicillin-binding protein 2 [Planctomycetales bacterium ZRK34]|nr:penicillin-binding protein 2 [Planctomycetales bacterium ZRK34]